MAQAPGGGKASKRSSKASSGHEEGDGESFNYQVFVMAASAGRMAGYPLNAPPRRHSGASTKADIKKKKVASGGSAGKATAAGSSKQLCNNGPEERSGGGLPSWMRRWYFRVSSPQGREASKKLLA